MEFDGTKCINSKETYKHIQELVSSIPLNKVKEDLSKVFYAADETVEFLYSVLSSSGNGILHGPGGFGKSDITTKFLNYYGIPSVVKVGNSSTDVESILGIPDIEKLTKESEYRVAFEKSVFNIPGVLILEEFLDVRPTVASALKDILSEGGYRQGNTFTESKIGPVIICSNKTPEEVSVDLSTAAFYKERFPYSMYTCWDDFSSKAYLDFYKTIYTIEEVDLDKYRVLASICAASCTNEIIISPRLAIKAKDLFFSSNNLKSLKYISSIDYSKIDEVEQEVREWKFFSNLNDKIIVITGLINSCSISTAEDYVTFIYITKSLKSQLQISNVVGDELLKNISTLIKSIDSRLEEFLQFVVDGKIITKTSMSDIKSIKDEINKYL